MTGSAAQIQYSLWLRRSLQEWRSLFGLSPAKSP